MKRRFYFTLLVLAVIVLAVPGFVAKGLRRLSRSPRGFTRRASPASRALEPARSG
jgi:hypothetical protein